MLNNFFSYLLIAVIVTVTFPLFSEEDRDHFLKVLPEKFAKGPLVDSLILNNIRTSERPEAFFNEVPERFRNLESLLYLKKLQVPFAFAGACFSLFPEKLSTLEDLVALNQKMNLGDIVSFYKIEGIPKDLDLALKLHSQGISLNVAKRAIGPSYTPEAVETLIEWKKEGVLLEKTPRLLRFITNGGDLLLAKKIIDYPLPFSDIYPSYLKDEAIPNSLKDFSFIKKMDEEKISLLDLYKTALALPPLLRERNFLMAMGEKLKEPLEKGESLFKDGTSLYDIVYPRNLLAKKEVQKLSLSRAQKQWVLEEVHRPALYHSLEQIDQLLLQGGELLRGKILSKDLYHRAFSCQEEIINDKSLAVFYTQEGKTKKEVCLERVKKVLDKVSQINPETGEMFNCFVVSGVEEDYNGAFSKPKTGELLKTEFGNYQGHFCKLFRSFKELDLFATKFLSDEQKRKILVFGMAHGGPYGDFHGDARTDFPGDIFQAINHMNERGHHVALVLDSCYSSYLLREQIQHDKKVSQKLKTSQEYEAFLDQKRRMCLLVSGGLDQKGDIKMSIYKAISTLFEKNYKGKSILEMFHDLTPMTYKNYRHPLISALPWEYLQDQEQLKGSCLEGHEKACKLIYEKNLSYIRASIHYLPDGIDTFKKMYFNSKKENKDQNKCQQEKVAPVLDDFDQLIEKLKQINLENLPLKDVDRARLQGCQSFVIP